MQLCNKRNLILTILAVLIMSCEKEVILDLSDMEGGFLVVEGDIDDRYANQWIRLTGTTSYYDQPPAPPVSDAYVKVYDGETDFVFRESSSDSLKGFYINGALSSQLREGTYRLTIEHDGKVYLAKSEYRPVPELDSISIDLNFFTRIGIVADTIYDISIHFKNLPGENYYLTNLYINDKLKTTRPSDKTIISDEYLEEYASVITNSVNQQDITEGDMIIIEIRSISGEQFDFYNDFFYQTDMSGNPFAGAPPANIPTNISEGGLGFFQVSATYEIEREFIYHAR